MTDSFISEKNKALVWQLLMDAKAFINIPESYTNRVVNLYEKIIQETSTIQNLTLTQKNKLVLQKMSQLLANIQSQRASPSEISSEAVTPPLKEVKLKIDSDFENKKEEFFNLVNHNKPDDVSFNDDLDQPFGEKELDNKLNTLLHNRKYDIQKSFPDKPIDVSSNPTVKFANPISIEEKSEEKTEKKILPPSANELLNKLKKIDISVESSTQSELQTIISQQSQIISLLTALNNKLN